MRFVGEGKPFSCRVCCRLSRWVMSGSFSENMGLWAGVKGGDAARVHLLLRTKEQRPNTAKARRKYGAPIAAWVYGSERTGMVSFHYEYIGPELAGCEEVREMS